MLRHEKRKRSHLLSHFGNTANALLVFSMVFLKLKKLVCRLLGKEFNSYSLIVHSNLRLTTHVGSCHGITHTTRSIFIFLD